MTARVAAPVQLVPSYRCNPRTAGAVVPAALTLMVVVHAFLGERLYVTAGTGGRGLVSITALLVPAVVGLWALVTVRDEVRELVSTPGFWPRAGCLGLATMILPLLGVLLMGYPSRSAFGATEGVIGLSAVLCGFVLRLRTARAAQTTAWFVVAGCALQLFAALAQADLLVNPVTQLFTQWDAVIRSDYGTEQVVSGRAIGTLINPNTLGFAAVLGGLYAGYFLVGVTRIGTLIAATLTLLLSQSRGALIAAVLSTVFVAILSMRRTGRRSFGSIGGALVVCGIALGLLATPMPSASMDALRQVPAFDTWAERIGSGLRALANDHGDDSLASRYEAWGEAIEFSAAYPLGTLGPPQLLFGRSIDNEFLRLWCQGGILMVLAFVLVIGASVRPGFESRETGLAMHAVAALAVASASAVTLGSPPVALMWLAIGLALGSRVASGPSAAISESPVEIPVRKRPTAA